ncbi:NAD(P)H-dependent glycerol-3-phosphate dehydrogenase [Pseudomaricurvus alcaniphilus]|uniref:NAD(P)H-dependent glycerol-3-phosphate dehydrogenase n=1 Tax=Pseudomaricurvus alcaniphilus TaxID=1166482 RepID=UPI001409B4A9|nr:NAD(P)H-dependent glycerol-3-phosphate dehydrogenase [Pseudomaricurvus alcaniphilus]NHN36628.1 NAD(P)H-dependent glycerol-3-phosphate dehydrogenase [Pseudomaricurvus alcaniphilus]
MKLNVCVLGGGSWGTTVASLISRNTATTLWARDQATVDEINRNHSNEKYLPGAKLQQRLTATTDLEGLVAKSDVVVMGIPSQSFRGVLEVVKKNIRPWVPVVSLTKGLELSTGKRMTEIINEILPGHPAGVLTGPNLAREVMAGYAAASVIAMEDPVIVKELQKIFHAGLFRVYTNNDVIGCELGGVFKNIIAIAAGMGDGQGAGENTRSAIIARGLAEMTRLGVAMGGKARTFAGLAGVGDLVATCTSEQSRNRHVGFYLGQGKTVQEISADMHMVAEGVKSAPAVLALAEAHNVEVPIMYEVLQVIQGESTALRAYRELLRADIGHEADIG